jgi:hypothetical protein
VGMQTAGLDPDTSAILVAGGLPCALMATVFTGIVALAARVAGSRSPDQQDASAARVVLRGRGEA